ncbi:hypothetical protein GCM10009743_23890 [Kribbella swartbergensis]
MAADEISVDLSRDQALVLFDWLARTSEAGEPVGFVDQAEQRALWDLEACLEALLPEVLAADYQVRLRLARDKVRDSDA